jgi:iron complex outermembrane receptor protein
MIRRGTPQLAGIGDGLGQNPTVGGQPIPVAVGSAADNNFAFPQVIDPRQGNGCSLGSLGGSQTQGVRLQLRNIVSDRLEFNLSGDYSTQTSDPPVETLLTSRNDTAYNNSTLFPKWGIRADGRFITGNPYTNFATFGNAVAGTQYDETTHLRSYGVSLVGDYGITDKTHLKVIGSYRAYDTTWINDSDLTPFELIQTNYLQSHHQSQFEAQLTGSSFADRLD